MRCSWLLLLLVLAILGCQAQDNPIAASQQGEGAIVLTPASQSGKFGTFLPWGVYTFEIGRDGSYAKVIPDRTACAFYGYHLNAVKLLETSPCTNCVGVDNVHLTPEGNVSIDVSITHPFSNPVYTGFDVRGIIMFPASQYVPDDELREQAGMGPYEGKLLYLFSSSEKGDAELANTEGWTELWAPNPMIDGYYGMWTESGYPIFDYYQGKFATGANIGTLNPFIRFHSSETRHMFEVGKTVTRTYIIKPPAQGPIEACYAVYAHWAEPDVTPVTNPASDFPLIANSAMPYELEIWQDGVLDPDAPHEVMGEQIHIHMKHWGVVPLEGWNGVQTDFMGGSIDWDFTPHPCGNPDEYWLGGFFYDSYGYIPDAFPGTWPFIIAIPQHDPISWGFRAGCEWYILDLQFGALDGQW